MPWLQGISMAYCISLSAFCCQKWRQETMPDMASGYPSTDLFDAISGVKKLLNFIPVINCPTSANRGFQCGAE